jgi:hypothetical protein
MKYTLPLYMHAVHHVINPVCDDTWCVHEPSMCIWVCMHVFWGSVASCIRCCVLPATQTGSVRNTTAWHGPVHVAEVRGSSRLRDVRGGDNCVLACDEVTHVISQCSNLWHIAQEEQACLCLDCYRQCTPGDSPPNSSSSRALQAQSRDESLLPTSVWRGSNFLFSVQVPSNRDFHRVLSPV